MDIDVNSVFYDVLSSQGNHADILDEDGTKPSAPRDVAKLYVKVDWPGKLPLKWKSDLQKALQAWCNSEAHEKCSVDVVQLLGDKRTAEVEITPSTALKDIKTATLTFKQLDNPVQIHFLQDAPKSADNVSNPKVNLSVPDSTDGGTVHPEHMTDAGAAVNVPGLTETPGAATVPPFLYCYLSQVYKEKMEEIENQFGVKIKAETRVLISAEKANEKSDCVHRATQAFSDLYHEATRNLKSVSVPQTHIESEVIKQVLHNIPHEENKIMLSMSANNSLLFGPENITSAVEKRLHLEPGAEQTSSINMETPSSRWTTMQTAKSLDMDIKDTHDHIEMDKTHWQLMEAAYQTQIPEIQNKYGVQFVPEHDQDVIKVSAKSITTHQVNLEAHALRALTHLYQKVVTSAVTCDLKDDSYTEKVSQAFKRISAHHGSVGGGERNGGWKLFGLPKHLVPAIADIEKILGQPVFNEKTKQLLRYPWEVPRASGFQRGGTGLEAMRGAQGTELTGGTVLQNYDFIQKPFKEIKGKKFDESEEDKCPICLDTFTQKRKLKCGYEFCKDCLKQLIQMSKEICPVCKKLFGILKGNQPDGTMDIQHVKHLDLPGFPQCGMIIIHYNIPNGTQTSEHPNPGKPYYGTKRTAYLPDNAEGNHVLKLLRRAFDQRLIFTVGTITKPEEEDVVIWNGIHHKTSTHGGPECFGYPDLSYLTRVKEELKTKGIE